MQRPQVISWTNIHAGDDASNPDDAMYDHRLLAEGDSWFTLGGLPTSNLLFSMKFDGSTIIVNCGSPGDTIRNMGQIASNSNLRKAMSKRDGYRWDAILLSGGGNDLIDDADEIVKRRSGAPADPAAYCDEERLTKTLIKGPDTFCENRTRLLIAAPKCIRPLYFGEDFRKSAAATQNWVETHEALRGHSDRIPGRFP